MPRVEKKRAGGTWSEALYQHLHEVFKVEDGYKLVRIKKERGEVTPLGRVGSFMRSGYRQTNWKGFGEHNLCRVQYEHRVIFFMTYKEMPLQIDHIDGDRGNNHILNLRASNSSDNQMNRHKKVGSSPHLPIGVYEIERKGREGLWYNAVFEYKGLRKNTTFRCVEKAIAKRKEWEVLYGPY